MKDKIQKKLEQTLGHKKLFAIGMVLLMCGIFSYMFAHQLKGFKIICYIISIVLGFLSVSAVIFASDIKHKGEK